MGARKWREGVFQHAGFSENQQCGEGQAMLSSYRSLGCNHCLGCDPPRSLSRNHNGDGVVSSGAGGDRWSLLCGLGLPIAVGSAHLYRIVSSSSIPVVDPQPPSVRVELRGERRVVPALAVVGGDFNPLYPSGRSPGDAAYLYGARLQLIAIFDGVYSGLGYDRTFLRPATLDPISVEVPISQLYLSEPLGCRDVAVEPWNYEPYRVAMLYG